MKLAITGPRGFIGRHVAAVAAAAGHQLLLWDGRGRAPVGTSAGHLGLAFDSPAATAHLDGVDALIHLAGLYPRFGERQPSAAELEDSNVQPTAAVIEACARAGVPHLVLASSAAVYDTRMASAPLGETAAVDALGAYAASKLQAEALVRESTVARGMRGTSLRLFNVYGPGLPTCSVFCTIALQVLAGIPVRVHDDRPVRDFIHVADVARALIAAAITPGTRASTINIGSGIGTSVRDLGERILRAAGRSDAVEAITSGPSGSGNAVVADIALARRALQWEPRVGLAQGIAETLDSLRGIAIARVG